LGPEAAVHGATAALDRITLPQDVLDRIAPTALPRSSLIILDEPPHRETNYRTKRRDACPRDSSI
jgi:hypothetical protein